MSKCPICITPVILSCHSCLYNNLLVNEKLGSHRHDTLKGSCHDRLTFYMWKSLIWWVWKYFSYSNMRFPFPRNQAKAENPGTMSALKSGYQERYLALKTGYLEEYWHWKLATGRVLALKTGYPEEYWHWKQATRKRNSYWEISFPGSLFSVPILFR